MKTPRRTFLAGTASIVTSTLALPLSALSAQTKTPPAKPAAKKEKKEANPPPAANAAIALRQ